MCLTNVEKIEKANKEIIAYKVVKKRATVRQVDIFDTTAERFFYIYRPLYYTELEKYILNEETKKIRIKIKKRPRLQRKGRIEEGYRMWINEGYHMWINKESARKMRKNIMQRINDYSVASIEESFWTNFNIVILKCVIKPGTRYACNLDDEIVCEQFTPMGEL